MPATTRKRKVSPIDDNDDIQEPPGAKKATQSKRRAAARTKRQDSEEDVTDVGRQTSRNFFNTAQQSKKKSNAAEAKEDVKRQVKEVIDFINQVRDRPSSPSHNVAALKDLLVSKDASSTSDLNLSVCVATDSKLDESVFKAAKETLRRFRTMVENYEKANRRKGGIKKPTWMRWKQDSDDLRALNEATMSTAARTIHGIVVPYAQKELECLPDTAGDIQAVAWDLLEDSRPKKMEDTWGALAQGVLRAATSVARLLAN